MLRRPLLLSFAISAAGLSACGTSSHESAVDTGSPPILTEHCGDITGTETWTEAMNKHVITCDVHVSGALEIEPGVEVYLDPGTTLFIDGGSFAADGTDIHPVLFESNADIPADGDHGGIVADNATIVADYLTVRHGGKDGAALLDLNGGTADLADLELANCPNGGIRSSGTFFTRIAGADIAYVDIPLELPWSAAAVTSDVRAESVGQYIISLLEPEITGDVTLPASDIPYASPGVVIASTGRLEVQDGARLELGGDLQAAGSFVVYGTSDEPAQVVASEGTTATISIDATSPETTIRYADFEGIGLTCANDLLYLKDSVIADPPDIGLLLTGGVKDASADNFADNIFSGPGYGTLAGFEDLLTFGANDWSGSGFDGPAFTGATLDADLVLGALPFNQFLFTTDLVADGTKISLTKTGVIRFSEGAGLDVSNGTLVATGTGFLQEVDQHGGWKGITLQTGTDASVLDDCEVASGGAGGGANITVWSNATITNSIIRDSAGWGILVSGKALPTMTGNIFDGNDLGDVGP
jgi:hypothetical protein